MRTHLASVGVTAAVLALTAVASLARSEAPKPAGGEAAIGGYCPVPYVAMNHAIKGNPQYKTEQQGSYVSLRKWGREEDVHPSG